MNFFHWSNSELIKQIYLSINKEFKLLIKIKHIYDRIQEKFKSTRDAKEFWSLAKSLTSNKLSCNASIQAEEWFNQFKELLIF